METDFVKCSARHTTETTCTLEKNHAGPHKGPNAASNLEVPQGEILTWDLSYGNLYTLGKHYVGWDLCDWCKVPFDEDGKCACVPSDSQRWEDSSEATV